MMTVILNIVALSVMYFSVSFLVSSVYFFLSDECRATDFEIGIRGMTREEERILNIITITIISLTSIAMYAIFFSIIDHSWGRVLWQ